MKVAPVQLLQTRFRKICIEVDDEHAPKDPPNPLTEVFNFEGVTFNSEVSLGIADAENELGKVYFVSLHLVVDNAARPEKPKQKFSPYKIDVLVDALILIPLAAEKLGKAEDLAIVNGATFAWGAAREQIINVTARMPVGSVTLPSMNFHSLKDANHGAETTTEPQGEVQDNVAESGAAPQR